MGRGKGHGTGSPISFKCAVERREYWKSGPDDHVVKLTGRTKPSHARTRGARSTDTQREYRCSCGHTGWSTHVDLVPRESKMSRDEPIKAADFEWKTDEYGDRADQGLDETVDKLEGWTRGDEFVIDSDDEDEGIFAGDEGLVIGFSKPRSGLFGNTPMRIVAYFEDQGMVHEVDPHNVSDPE